MYKLPYMYKMTNPKANVKQTKKLNKHSEAKKNKNENYANNMPKQQKSL